MCMVDDANKAVCRPHGGARYGPYSTRAVQTGRQDQYDGPAPVQDTMCTARFKRARKLRAAGKTVVGRVGRPRRPAAKLVVVI